MPPPLGKHLQCFSPCVLTLVTMLAVLLTTHFYAGDGAKALHSCREWTLLSGVIRNDWNQWSEVLGNKAEAYITKRPWLSQILVLSVISHQKPWWVRAVTDSKQCAASGAYHTPVKVTRGADLWSCLRMIVPGPCILIMEPLAVEANHSPCARLEKSSK